MKKIIYLLVFLVLFNSVYALDIEKIYPAEVSTGQIINIEIKVTNDLTSTAIFKLKEQLPNNVKFISPAEPDGYSGEVNLPYFEETFSLAPQETFSFTYSVKVDIPGALSLSPTTIVKLDDNQRFFSEPIQIQIDCIPDGLCQDNDNFLNCPQDCPSGSEDNYCDLQIDGVCDSDCTEEDVDCDKDDIVGEESDSSTFFRKYIYQLFFLILLIVLGFLGWGGWKLVKKFVPKFRDRGLSQGQMPQQKYF